MATHLLIALAASSLTVPGAASDTRSAQALPTARTNLAAVAAVARCEAAAKTAAAKRACAVSSSNADLLKPKGAGSLVGQPSPPPPINPVTAFTVVSSATTLGLTINNTFKQCNYANSTC
ncbi:hypothetical protein GTZ99_02410 [Novosphingobium sp. FSY-8]|uniref:Uncharacterized protein n=1 Tax=Novosphingobium ovatum TaxID=1908523 RepID=A0ABW9XA52_9SPHN|nr:hypothetical protein [Novosphingobium ovatum]NBC35405.1 hypothetical protein [Novosphingobium ovatum]